MSRIEDNEAERQERIRQEQKLDAKRVEAKKVEAGREFNTLMSKAHDTKSQSDNKEQQRQKQGDDAQRNLMARRGIASNNVTGERISRNADMNEAATKRLQNHDAERSKRAGGPQQSQSTQASGENRAVVRSGSKNRDSSSEGRDKSRKGESKETESVRSAVFAQINQAVMAMDGVGAKAGSLGGPTMRPSLKEVIDQIVRSVRQGVDSTKGFQTIQIDLHDDVLAGARLTFVNTQAGIHLSVNTGHDDIAKLLSSGQSAHELSQALSKAKVNLLALEVNDTRVLG